MATSKGSEWAKWDLHVHTPCSLHNNYGGDTAENWEKFITDLENLPSEFKAIGVNDYLFLDGYKKILTFKNQGRLANIKLLLPVIELRIKHFGNVHKDDPLSRVNMHVIFSDKLTPEVIEAQFISALQSAYELAPNSTERWSGVLTRDSLIDFGTKIINTSPAGTHNDGPIKTGFNNLNFDEEKIFNTLLQSTYFTNKYLTAVGKTEWEALRWDGSAAEKKNIINKVSFVFTAAPSVEQFLKGKNKLKEQQVNHLLIDCSDAHNYSSSADKDRIGNCFTWIKSELTFDGLKQVINEHERLYTGDMPAALKRVKDFPTKFIKSISVKKIDGTSLTTEWFNDFEVSINPELTAIIGNKGKGKSALSDIIGLVANAHIEENDFSFLHKDKFRRVRPDYAKEFVATLEWEAGDPDVRLLNAKPDFDALEKVKYIPQSFLEKLCTSVDKRIFEEELEKVIFSRLENDKKLGKNNLPEVIKEKKVSFDTQASQLKSSLSIINAEIVDLELKNGASYRKTINEALQGKTQELAAHDQNTLPVIDPPAQDQQTQQRNQEKTTSIDALREIIKTQQEAIDANTREINAITFDVNELSQLKQGIGTLSTQVTGFITQNTPVAAKHSLDLSTLISYKAETKVIDDLITDKTNRQSALRDLLRADNPNNPNTIIANSEQQVRQLNSELEGPTKEYQEYLTRLSEWSRQRDIINGSLEVQGSLIYLQKQKEYLENQIAQDIANADIKRDEILMQLLQIKVDVSNIYRELYSPVSEFIVQNNSALKDYQVDIDVALELQGFEEKFFSFISNGVAGSFYGSTESRQVLTKITELVDFDNINAVKDWVKEILNYLNFDKRQPDNTPRLLGSQIKTGFDEKQFYDFLFSVDYYEPIFQLKLGGKNLNQLSPGERGALLLIFYLLLDKNDVPIIIDQPEENLDNQSVYNILVHFIKKAKERRQIIIVTHNPNLAVVCDAEQIIRMDIAKNDGNKVSMITGGIENTAINTAIVDILEGTRPAFDNRTVKYEVSNPQLN